jgi:hypothetical protein
LTADFIVTVTNNTKFSIFKRTPTIINTEVSADVDAEAYLCDLNNVRVTDTIKFTDGRDFRICVKQAVDDTFVYSVIMLVDLN